MLKRSWDVFFGHFKLGRAELISLTGGGGKTTLLHALALHLFQSGGRVLVGTTTKIHTPRLPSLAIGEGANFSDILRALRRSFRRRRLLAMLAPPKEGSSKRTGLDPLQTDRLWESGVADHCVIEADGSRQMPLKAWAEHEPPIPPRTSLLCSVLGADRLDEPLDERHVFRLDVMAERFGFRPGDILSPKRLAILMNSPLGGLKNAPAGARKILFLNRSDLLSPARREDLARRFLPELAERLRGWDALLMASLRHRRVDRALWI